MAIICAIFSVRYTSSRSALFPSLQQLLIGNSLALGLFVGELRPWRGVVRQPGGGIFLFIQLRWAVLHAGTLEAAENAVHLIGEIIHRGLRRTFAGDGGRDVLPPQLRELWIIRNVVSGRRPCNASRAAIELDQAAVFRGVLGEVIVPNVAVTNERKADDRLLQRHSFR